MNISHLTESKIIEIFRKNFTTTPNIFLGVNTNFGKYNDAGVIDIGDGRVLVVTTDMIGLKTHIPDIATPEQVGIKSVVVNISDLAAMGASPLGLVMAIGIPQECKIDYLDRLSKGMNRAAEEYSTCIFGGDVNMTDDIIISGTAIGITSKEKLFTRNNANIGDIVCVSGFLGSSAAAFYAWKNKLELPLNIRDELFPNLLEPIARLKESLILRDLNVVSSCGDISDGLGWELHKTGQASNVGFQIYEELLPIKKETIYVANSLKIDPLDLILYHGEDFELLITMNKNKWNNLKEKFKKYNINLIKIGEVCNKNEGITITKKDGNKDIIKNLGYDQFNRKLK
ncbi:MAG: thiamine-phosphate kinase [Candidatus Helarchaeota archaeon]